MFWSLVIPLQVTAGILAALAIGLLLAGLIQRWRWWVTGLAVIVLPVVAAWPLLKVVDAVVNRNRFGTFTYPTTAAVQEEHVLRWLPPTATDMTVVQRQNGFTATYTISQAEVQRWLEKAWAAEGQPCPPGKEIPSDFVLPGNIPPGPALLAEEPMIAWDSPRAPNGAGYQIWWRPRTGTACQEAFYW